MIVMDYIKCTNCMVEQLVERGEDVCIHCKSYGTNMWVDNQKQEVSFQDMIEKLNEQEKEEITEKQFLHFPPKTKKEDIVNYLETTF